MSEEKGLFEEILDFSFHSFVTPRMLKLLYSIHLLLGLVAAVAFVVIEFNFSVPQGLLAILLALVGLFFWLLYCRVAVEVLAVLFRIGDAIAPQAGTPTRQ